jgi:hypothetical protein
MTQAIDSPPTTRFEQDERNAPIRRRAAQPRLWQLNLLRFGYLFVGGGLAIVKWPLLFTHGPWELKDGTVECMLVAMSLLALLGLRYPLRMLPILLFEVAWKLLWLAVIALPLWTDDKLTGPARGQAGTVVLVVMVIAVIPWGYVFTRYVSAVGDPWRRGGRS